MPKIEANNHFPDVVALSEWSLEANKSARDLWRKSNFTASWEDLGPDYEDARDLLMTAKGGALQKEVDNRDLAKVYAETAKQRYANQATSFFKLDSFELTRTLLVMTRVDKANGEVSFCAMPRITFNPPDGNRSRDYGYIFPNGAIFAETHEGRISTVAFPIMTENSSPSIYSLIPEAQEDLEIAQQIVKKGALEILKAQNLVEVVKTVPNLPTGTKAENVAINHETATYFATIVNTELPYVGLHMAEGSDNGIGQPTRIEYQDIGPWRTSLNETQIVEMVDKARALDDYSFSTNMLNEIMEGNLDGNWTTLSDL